MYKRIIPSVLLKNGNAVKGKQFNSWRQACDVISYTKTLSHKKADEISILNIDREISSSLISILRAISTNISCPLSYGGGIRSIEDIKVLSSLSIDRFILGSACYGAELNTNIEKIINLVGSAALSASIDILEDKGEFYRLDHDINEFIKVDLLDYLRKLIEVGFAEIIITAINNDGLMLGIPSIYEEILSKINYPRKIVIAGGIGKTEDIKRFLEFDSVVGIMIGSALIYSRLTISDFHKYGLECGLPLRDI